ncbi:Nucleotide-binding universal stress protein, UspA family [Saccharopolyspora shandongensis]|uniref:Nucleotide-binding universal stress protein, UspA family n=1 Tax=Saccharopolyspora shandongensis TaxID=418495 RepID=A0A1H3EBE3_9PSEU|nr:universal stress protein [Saccharopolyspora shandongensis]SDX75224.1 Nucleotide-binding universal stress protein, UspA family [Saccharopolyspora shandongensis]
MTRAKQSVVVGVDGSESSLQAALWAAAEAERLSVPLRVVLINNDPTRDPFAEEVVRDIADSCRRAVGELEITEEVAPGHPAEELVHRSASARLVVVGSRGQGAFRETLLGSISAAVATHASSPVVVVPGHDTATSGPVVVGVDDSTGSRKALRYAFDAADRRRSELVAVQALPNAYFIPGPYDHPDRDELLASAEKRLAEQVSACTDSYPQVVVRQVVSNIPPVRALREAAQHAQLLVVGHRGLGGFSGLLVGSVARGVLHHPPCPVAVVPG